MVLSHRGNFTFLYQYLVYYSCRYAAIGADRNILDMSQLSGHIAATVINMKHAQAISNLFAGLDFRLSTITGITEPQESSGLAA